MLALLTLLQLTLLSLFSAATAAPLQAAGHGNTWQYGTAGGVVGFVVLILDIIVFIEVLQSNRTVLGKVGWCLLVFLFPVVGMAIYWLFSNREAHKSGGYEAIA